MIHIRTLLKKMTVFALTLALASSVVPSQGQAATTAQPKASSLEAKQSGTKDMDEQQFKLSNGLTVYLIKDKRFPLVCTRLYVRTGSTNETAEQFGISHVLEHMVFKGTKTRPNGQVAKDIESLGGYINAYTSFDKTCYLTDMPARHWQKGIEVVYDMAFNPSLNPQDLENEKPVIISELEGNDDKPEQRLFKQLQASALAHSPYAHPIIGYHDTIRAVTSDSLRAYIAKWYQPQNMQLVVAGDIDLAEVQAYVEKLFSPLKNTTELVQEEHLDPSSLADGPRVLIERGKWNKIYLGFGVAMPGLTDLSSVSMDILSYLLSGDGTSWFERRYRQELQLVDAIEVSNMGFSRVGMFTIVAVLDPEKLEPFFTTFIKDLSDLKMEVFTPAELERAKFNMEDSYNRASETLNGKASWRASMAFDFGGRQGELNLRNAQRNVTFEQIETMWAEYMRPERVRVRVLAPDAARLPDLEAMLDQLWPAAKDKDTQTAQLAQGEREVIDLGGGSSLILIPDSNVPYVSMNLVGRGGNLLLTEKTQGVGTLTARLLSAGCGDMDRQAFDSRLAAKAMHIAASAGSTSFSVSATAPTSANADLLAVLETMFTSPRFEEKELNFEVNDLKADIAKRQDRPLAFLMPKMRSFLYGTHAYGIDTLGTLASIEGLTREDVRTYWDKQKAQPWSIAVAGTFDREQIIAWAKALQPSKDAALSVPEPIWGKEKKLELHMPAKNQAHLMLVFPTVKRTDADVPALMLLQSILSGQSGLLFSQMRDEDGLGYTVAAINSFQTESGFMLFYIGTTPELVDKARTGFEQIIRSLHEKPLDKALLEAGCNSLEGDYYRGRQSLASRSSTAAEEAVNGLPQDFTKTLLAKTRSLTPEDLQKVAQKYLQAGNYDIVLKP